MDTIFIENVSIHFIQAWNVSANVLKIFCA